MLILLRTEQFQHQKLGQRFLPLALLMLAYQVLAVLVQLYQLVMLLLPCHLGLYHHLDPNWHLGPFHRPDLFRRPGLRLHLDRFLQCHFLHPPCLTFVFVLQLSLDLRRQLPLVLRLWLRVLVLWLLPRVLRLWLRVLRL